jgi:ABC-type nitrate/sulfonate/bicarbonate transport system substrate-binding protein
MAAISHLTVLLVATMFLGVSVSAYLVMNNEDHDISVAWANKDCYEPFWIADALGFWTDEGVKVEGKIMNNGSECAAAVLSGNADMGGMGADPLLRMLRDDRGASLICRYQTGFSQSEFVARDGGNNGKLSKSILNGFYDAEGILIDEEGLKEYLNGAVKGARVGMQLGTAYWSWFLGFLENIDLTADDVTVVPLDFNVQVAALTNKEVDIISGGSPNTENALSLSSDNFMIKDPDPTLMSICLMASGKAVAGKADEIVKVLKGLQRACDFINEYPEEAAKIIIDVYGRTWSIENQVKVFERSIWGLDLVDADIEALGRAGELINAAGRELKGLLPAGDTITDRISDALLDSAGLPTAEFIELQEDYGIPVIRSWRL